jgi:hypothetical protein
MKNKHSDRGKSAKQLRDKDEKGLSKDKVSTAWENLDQKLNQRLDHLDQKLGRDKQDRGDNRGKK